MIAAIQLKQVIAGVYFLNIVIYKLSYWQKFKLILLFKINKNSKVSLYNTVLSFYLAINLMIKNSCKFLFNTKKVAKQ